jgi:hypothetical protein
MGQLSRRERREERGERKRWRTRKRGLLGKVAFGSLFLMPLFFPSAR